ncbi:TetR/AcrR family transcriptional regulator [Pseudomonas sp. P8_241]|uniref:TetR/AcrR family transcriptional regulator n=1 Tax=Pseudomonas sp. P8_241 TaxID=3043445 RepID=UPI002A3622F9|nr:TetR/AcrR family transcriptional regulator [Pseudomonas sp. P8_241]WPN45127.1 TetR/AcrR family transcriptional regulator [Pseudomonas sp. P8_241]
MSRVRADDYDDKKQLILKKAAALFATRGFGSATMIDVAKACGASKSRIYHYFSSKEDVLFDIIIEHIKNLSDELSTISSRPIPAKERFAQFVTAFIRCSADSRNEHLVLVNDIKFLPEDKRKQVLKLETHLVSMLITLLQEINPTLMTPVKVRTPYAMLLFGMVIWTFTWYEKNGAVSPEELASRISHLFLAGFQDSTPPV